MTDAQTTKTTQDNEQETDFASGGSVFDDFARIATGAFGALQGLQSHIKSEVRSHVRKLLTEIDAVPREEFEIVQELAKKTAEENKKLSKKIKELESKIK